MKASLLDAHKVDNARLGRVVLMSVTVSPDFECDGQFVEGQGVVARGIWRTHETADCEVVKYSGYY